MAIRKLMREQTVLGTPELHHLMLGEECLLAGGCELCSDLADADPLAYRRPGLRWVLRVEHARRVWQSQRAALLATWWRACEDRGEPGASGVPVFAEVLFDGAALPRFNPRWPPEVVERWHMIGDNLAELRGHLVLHPQQDA